MNEVKFEVVGETKFEKARRIVSSKIHQGADWIRDNREIAVMYASAAVAGIGAVCQLVKTFTPSAQEKHDKRVDRQYYDPSTGVHWDLKRKATNRDRVELVQRKRNGENTEDILKDLKLIK